MTKIRHLAFNDLQTNANNKNAPIARADHSLWPQTALPVLPTILTNEQLQMSINKAQDILLHRHSSNHLAIYHPDFLPIYDMFPEHGGIFVHISLLGLLSSALNTNWRLLESKNSKKDQLDSTTPKSTMIVSNNHCQHKTSRSIFTHVVHNSRRTFTNMGSLLAYGLYIFKKI